MEQNEPVMRGTRERPVKKRDLISFWILGLCNNYGYVVMLTAAIDIISADNVRRCCWTRKHLKYLKFQEEIRSPQSFSRECTPMSTGAILLADIIPSFIIKSLSPFLPYNANYRVFISCMLSILSFLSVAFASSKETVIAGVIFTSFASGLGEPTFLAHTTHFNKNVVSTWSSGTGGAGIIGALSYSLMREIGLSSRQTLLLMILVPFLELYTFFLVLSKPNTSNQAGRVPENRRLIADATVETTADPPLVTLKQQFGYIPKLMIYFLPLSLVYFFEYFINQGLVRNFNFSFKQFQIDKKIAVRADNFHQYVAHRCRTIPLVSSYLSDRRLRFKIFRKYRTNQTHIHNGHNSGRPGEFLPNRSDFPVHPKNINCICDGFHRRTSGRSRLR